MSVSTLVLALSTFNENEIRAINVAKTNPNFYAIFYKRDGLNRVMMVPRDINDIVQLQMEVAILLSRNAEEQNRVGHLDA